MGFWREMFPEVNEHTGYSEYDDDYTADYADVDQRRAANNYRSSGRTLKIAFSAAGGLALIGGIVYATADTGPRSHASAEQTPDATATLDSGAAESDTPSPSASESESASPSPTKTKKASPSPSATSISPTPTKTHVVIPATPTPEATTSAPSEETYGACHINPNATSPDYRHRESICDKPVTAYTDSYGTTPAFEVNGPVMFNCLDAERGYVEASISNAVGWVALPDLANDVCN